MPILGSGIDGGPSPMTHDDLVARWRSDLATLQEYGAIPLAKAVEHCADMLEAVSRETKEEPLTMARGASESGYSEAHLRRLVTDEKIPNAGRKGAPRIRRGDLPRKPSTKFPQAGEAVSKVLRAYEC